MSFRWLRTMLDWSYAIDKALLPVRYLITFLLVVMGVTGIVFLFSGLKTSRVNREDGQRKTTAGFMLILILLVLLFVVFF